MFCDVICGPYEFGVVTPKGRAPAPRARARARARRSAFGAELSARERARNAASAKRSVRTRIRGGGAKERARAPQQDASRYDV